MDQNKKELEQKIAAASSPQELQRILNDAGEKIGPEDAAKLFEKLQNCGTAQELSPDELEAVSGGVDRDWLTDGCAATVEPGSDCWGTDYCVWLPVTYEHKPVDSICPVCGTYLYLAEVNYGRTFSGETYRYRCKTCGYEKKVYEI